MTLTEHLSYILSVVENHGKNKITGWDFCFNEHAQYDNWSIILNFTTA